MQRFDDEAHVGLGRLQWTYGSFSSLARSSCSRRPLAEHMCLCVSPWLALRRAFLLRVSASRSLRRLFRCRYPCTALAFAAAANPFGKDPLMVRSCHSALFACACVEPRG